MDLMVKTAAELGSRVAQARENIGMTQKDLAKALGIDRTSVVRLEAGSRKVSASELARVAQLLRRPIDWFVVESPASVISRRREGASGHQSGVDLDIAVEDAARDVQFLLERGLLDWPSSKVRAVPSSHEESESLARQVRLHLKLGEAPIPDLGQVAAQLGLVWLSLDLGTTQDGACVELADGDDDRVGVAVINGAQEPGRRRWTLAHELGHYLVGDAYAEGHSGGDVERFLNSFVAYFLMPRTGVAKICQENQGTDDRVAALTIAARYRVSWSAACSHLVNLEFLKHDRLDDLRRAEPTRGDYALLGETWEEELGAPSVPRAYTRQVLAAYVDGQLTGERTVDLLRGTLKSDDLPEPRQASMESLRSAFLPLA